MRNIFSVTSAIPVELDCDTRRPAAGRRVPAEKPKKRKFHRICRRCVPSIATQMTENKTVTPDRPMIPFRRKIRFFPCETVSLDPKPCGISSFQQGSPLISRRCTPVRRRKSRLISYLERACKAAQPLYGSMPGNPPLTPAPAHSPHPQPRTRGDSARSRPPAPWPWRSCQRASPPAGR